MLIVLLLFVQTLFKENFLVPITNFVFITNNMEVGQAYHVAAEKRRYMQKILCLFYIERKSGLCT